ncbi:MAG: hypothetical protein H8E10_17100 [Desulfobacterales bacterium]|nr:hypothetical protein [Desulfobacterales bacterium]MBL7102486.1 hypothetical protein [Desulfobacteraceae bacterium]MBL7173160.1 hypothetical protein [Desulfobacteraceae bacterium]
MAIKGVLKEELENSIIMQKKYEEELQKLPVGSLIKKKIKGHEYYYKWVCTLLNQIPHVVIFRL